MTRAAFIEKCNGEITLCFGAVNQGGRKHPDHLIDEACSKLHESTLRDRVDSRKDRADPSSATVVKAAPAEKTAGGKKAVNVCHQYLHQGRCLKFDAGETCPAGGSEAHPARLKKKPKASPPSKKRKASATKGKDDAMEE